VVGPVVSSITVLARPVVTSVASLWLVPVTTSVPVLASATVVAALAGLSLMPVATSMPMLGSAAIFPVDELMLTSRVAGGIVAAVAGLGDAGDGDGCYRRDGRKRFNESRPHLLPFSRG
jgi:small-conductance mechanosensitive channel